jgi:hypothetical protein
MKTLSLALSAVATAVLAAGSAAAATVTLVGDTVTYSYDSVANAGALALFGTPFVAGDTLVFTPNTFRAESTNGAGVATANATFVVDVVANNPGVTLLTDISVSESGDYFLSGGDASVTASGLLQVVNTGTGQFASDLLDVSDLSAVGALTEWNGTADVDFSDVWGSEASGVRITLENNLAATTLNLGEQAFIEKKFEGIDITTTTIPVPNALLLSLSAFGALFAARRRSN